MLTRSLSTRFSSSIFFKQRQHIVNILANGNRFASSLSQTTQMTRNIDNDIICSTPDIKIDSTLPFINGNFMSTEESMVTIDPRTGDPICEYNICNEHDTHKAILSAREAYDNGSWSRLSSMDRSKLLHQFADIIESRRDYIAMLETYDTGKPLAESHFDIDISVETIRYYAGYALQFPFDSQSGGLYTTLLQPVGVVGCIVPWNYPFMQMIFKIATAFACGNTCVVKPPETAPLTCIYSAYLASEAGFPDGVFNVITGLGKITGTALVNSPLIDKISFTGSTATGKLIMKTLDPRKKLTLELGGKSAVIISDELPDCFKLDDIVNLFIEASFANSGQVCTAPTRLFIHENIYDEFVTIATNYAQARVVADPFSDECIQGPVQNGTQYSKILDILERSRNPNGKDNNNNNNYSMNVPRICTGGNKIGNKGYFIEPTIFADVEDDMLIAKEEIFGPTMQLLKYCNIDDAFKRANATEYGLAASYIGRNVDECNRAARELAAGTVFINCYDVWDSSIPFGGYKQSGFGREKGQDAIKWFTQRKSIFQQCRKPC